MSLMPPYRGSNSVVLSGNGIVSTTETMGISEGGAGTTMTAAEEKYMEEATAAAIIVVSSEAEADAVNYNDVDNLGVPLTYFVQSSTSG